MKKDRINKSEQLPNSYFNNNVSASVLSDVVGDWLHFFPELKRYKAGQKLLKKVGPIILGIELEKFLSDEYRPRVVAYNLIDNKDNKLIAVIDQTIKDKKGLDVSVKYKHHADQYVEACKLLKSQSRIDLLGTPTIEEIIAGIIDYIEYDALGVCFWSCQAIMQLSCLVEEKKEREKAFSKGYELLKQKVPLQFLTMQVNDVQKWMRDIEELDARHVNSLVEEGVRKYKLEGVI